MIDSGKFGRVVNAYDHKHNSLVTIKILPNSTNLHTAAAKNEIAILEKLRHHDRSASNLLFMFGTLVYRSHRCIVLEHLGISLETLMTVIHFDFLNFRTRVIQEDNSIELVSFRFKII